MTESSDTALPLNLQEARDGILLRLRSLQLICADNNAITSPRALHALLSLEMYTFMCNHSLKTDYVRNDLSALFDGYYIESAPKRIENNRWIFFKPTQSDTNHSVWIGYVVGSDILIPTHSHLCYMSGATSRNVLQRAAWHVRPNLIPYPTKQEIDNAKR